MDVLAVLTDKLIEFSNPSRLAVQQVNQASSDSSTNDNLADIIKRLDKTEARFTQKNTKSRSESRSRSRSRNSQPKTDKYFFHRKFGMRGSVHMFLEATAKALEN